VCKCNCLEPAAYAPGSLGCLPMCFSYVHIYFTAYACVCRDRSLAVLMLARKRRSAVATAYNMRQV
jgi:hypothetical protein